MKADLLGFVSPQGRPPEADPSLSGNLDLMHITAAPPMLKSGKDILEGNERFPGLTRFRQAIEAQPNVTIVESPEHLEDIGGTASTGILLGLQETPHDVDKPMLQAFYDEGIRVITPSYQDADHPIGSGYANPENPLTDKGKQFVLDCQDVGLIVDLSHLGHQTARDLLEFREKEGLTLPVLASHGGVYELYEGRKEQPNNLRNLPWDVLEGVVDADGIVGIYALTFGLSEKENSIWPFVEQVTKAIQRLGSTAVAIGTDSIYQKRDKAEWKAQTEWLITQVVKSGELEPRFPDIPFYLNRVDKMDVIDNVLVAEGIDAAVSEKVVGGNAINFFNRSL